MRTVALAAVAAMMPCGSANAVTVSLSYTGQDATNPALPTSSAGNGSFSTNATNSVGLADLTSFSFSNTLLANGTPVATFVYGLADLANFSATLSSGTLTALNFSTNLKSSADQPSFFAESVNVSALGANGTTVVSSFGVTLQRGSTTQATTPMPEPASWAMMITGFGAIGVTMRRRKVAGYSLNAGA